MKNILLLGTCAGSDSLRLQCFKQRQLINYLNRHKREFSPDSFRWNISDILGHISFRPDAKQLHKKSLNVFKKLKSYFLRHFRCFSINISFIRDSHFDPLMFYSVCDAFYLHKLGRRQRMQLRKFKRIVALELEWIYIFY